MLLPRKVGPFTLMRKLDADGISESFVAILDDPPGKQVVARRILPVVTRDTARIAQLRARVGDLRAAQHPTLVPLLDLVEADGDLYVLEEWSEGVDLAAIIAHCTSQGTTVPHNVYLNLATQVCNALEALHARPGAESGAENVLHLALTPHAMWVTTDGRVTVGRYGLSRSPTAIATSATGTLPVGVEYLAPEQTHQDQKLTPASDIFALGGILYELLTLRAMFRAESSLQTIHRVRRAEVTTQLLEVKEIMPGLDKVLFRALSLNPRHRYQRAFVLREDLRGLMAGYSFNDIETVTRAFLSPIVRAMASQGHDETPSLVTDAGGDTTGFLLPGKGTAGLPSYREPASRREGLQVQDLPLLGEGEVEHTDALLAEMSEPIAELAGRGGRGYDADQVDTSRKPSSAVPSRDLPEVEGDTDLRDGGTGWIPREPQAGLSAAPTRRSLGAQGSLGGQGKHENTQSLLDDSSIFANPMQELTAKRAITPHNRPIEEASRKPSEARTMEVKDASLDPPTFAKDLTRGRGQSPAARGLSAGETLLPDTLFSGTNLRPPDPKTRTLELDGGDDRWAEVPTANKHARDLSDAADPPVKVGNRAQGSPQLDPQARLGQASRSPVPTNRVTPPPASALRSSPSSVPRTAGPTAGPLKKGEDTVPQPPAKEITRPANRPNSLAPASQAPATSKPPVTRAPESPNRPARSQDSEPVRTTPPWVPVAAGVLVVGISFAVCTGIGLGAFVGLGGAGAVTLNPDQGNADQMAMAATPEPIAAPQPAPSGAGQGSSGAASAGTAGEPMEAVRGTDTPSPGSSRTEQGSASAVPVATAPAPAPAPVSPAPPAPPKPPITLPAMPKPPPKVVQAPAEIHKAVAMAAPPAPAPATSSSGTAEPMLPTSEIDRWAEAAYKGELSPGATQQLASIPSSDPGYTRARTLLYLDAKARGDTTTRDAHLAAMMVLPENKYNPVLLVEKALIAVEKQDWQTALKSSQTAEQHWARLPSELVFTRKAMIYEIEAVSNTGLFYASAGEDQDRLLQAIKGWQRYETHVRSKGRNDLVARAEENLNKLYEIQRRLE